MGERMTADRAEVLERMTTRLKSLPTDEVGPYFLVCFTILANNAPEVAHFILDRANERLGFEDDNDAGGAR